MKKPKPGVSPNPIVTGGKSMPKLSGPVGGMPKAGGLVGGAGTVVKKITPGPRKNSLAELAALVSAKEARAKTPGRAGIGTVASKMGAAPKVQPKPVIRSTAKPAMPSRKK